MNQARKYLSRPVLFIPVSSILFIAVLYFSTRGILLNKAILKANSKLEKSGYFAVWENPRFRGLNGVFAEGIYMHSKTGNNEARIDSLLIKVKVLPLITGNVIVRKLGCRSVRVQYSPPDSSELSGSSAKDTANILESFIDRDLAGNAYQYIRRFINHVPSKVEFGKIEFGYGAHSKISLNNLSFRQGNFTTDIELGPIDSLVILPVTGRFDRSDSRIQFQVINPDTGLLPVSLVKEWFGFSAGFDSLNFLIDLGQRNRRLVTIRGMAGISGLEINGKRLSTGNIFIDNLESEYLIRIGQHFIEVDSSSVVLLNRIKLNPYLKMSLQDDPVIDFRVLRQKWKAGDFFSSLPPGMFTSLTGTRAEGELDFSLDFRVNLMQPDSLHFNINLTGREFKIDSFGLDDYRMINHSFVHKVYSNGNLVASILVSPENPGYTAFESISPYLRYAVMTSEDGSFFFHNGFNPDAFRESIATNIKEGRFARGGSTISMQLVKNVFLTRNKTIARKIEEALIVWLIENQNLVSKQRMYEVYLNIIEWGPGIYGITEASKFYFNKRPSELRLEESVFLASIVPRPKWFKYTFVANGKPRPFFSAYFNRIKDLMVRKGFIQSYDTVGVMPAVTLTGAASLALDTAELRDHTIDFMPLEPIRMKEISIK